MPGRRLYRSPTERKIAGVCGGIAEYFDIDPVFVRIAAFLVTFPHGLGVIVYLICWAAIPMRSEKEPVAHSEPVAGTGPAASSETREQAPGSPPAAARPGQGGGELIAGGILIFIGLFFLLFNVGVFDWEIFRFWRWRFIWPVILIVLGLYVVSTSVRTARRGAGKGAF